MCLRFKRCVGESPPAYGARKAYCSVRPSFKGPCCLHYQLEGRAFVVGFDSYRQALTVAAQAIFSLERPFQQVLITTPENYAVEQRYASALAWRSTLG